MRRLVQFSGDALYRLALSMLPAWFGDRFALDMRSTFLDRQHEALASGGTLRMLKVTSREIGGTLHLAARSRLSGPSLLSLPISNSSSSSAGGHHPKGPHTEFQFMDTLFKDIRYAVRGFRKSPGFAAVAIITLALGIGVNTAIFSVVNAVLLAPLPVENPEQIVDVYSQPLNGTNHNSSSHADYLDLRAQSETLSGLVAYTNFMGNFARQGRNEIVIGEAVSDNYFDVFGVQPVLGRGFTAEEFKTEGSHPVVILSDAFWRTRFGANPTILGEQLTINGIDYTVVGVASASFGGMFPAGRAQMWVPVMMIDELEPLGNINSAPSASGDTRLTQRGQRFLWMRGRLKDGMTTTQAGAELKGIMAQLAEQYPISNEFVTVTVLDNADVRFNPDLDGFLAPIGLLLLAVVGLVLLVACANIANMLLARASARRKEIAVRLAIGASRLRLVRQLLTESMVLSLIGGGLGLFISITLTRAIQSVDLSLPIETDFNFGADSRVLMFALGASLLTGVMFGLVPALRASRPSLVPALKDADGSGRPGGWRPELRDALVVVQVAVSIVLLVGGALLIRSFANARQTDLGFDVDRTALMAVALDMIGYEQEAGATLLDTARLRLQAAPGVRNATMVSRAPLSINNNGFGIFIEGHQDAAGDRPYAIDGARVDPHYFATLGLSIIEGRDFEAADEGRPVAVITEAMASRYWPDERVVGKTFNMGFGDRTTEIIGVVENYKVNTPGEAPTPYIHIPFRHDSSLYAVYMVSTEADAAGQMRALEQVFLDLDPEIIFMQSGTARDWLNVRLLPVKLGAYLIGAFALLALSLAAVGLYGVIGYSVSRRTREIGIRIALGAESGKVRSLVVRQGMSLVIAGAILGTIAAFFVGRVLSDVLYGISAVDPISFTAAIGLLVLFALIANYIPAYRASKTDPMTALRSE